MLNLMEVIVLPTTSKIEEVVPLRVITHSHAQRYVQAQMEDTDTHHECAKQKLRSQNLSPKEGRKRENHGETN